MKKVRNPVQNQVTSLLLYVVVISLYRRSLSQRHIQHHHQHKPQREGHRAHVGVLAFGHLRDQLFYDDVHHRTRRKGEHVGSTQSNLLY